MSFTHILKSSSESSNELFEILDRCISDTNVLKEYLHQREIKVNYNLPAPYYATLLGTAFNHVARLIIQYESNKLNDFKKVYKVDDGMFNIALSAFDRIEYENIEDKESSAEDCIVKIVTCLNILNGGQSVQEEDFIYNFIIDVSIYTAQLEHIRRSGRVWNIKDIKWSNGEIIKKELYELTELFRHNLFSEYREIMLHDNIICNPHFGAYSLRVLGADANIVCGKTLIQFKTSKSPKDNVQFDARQAVGYGLMGRLNSKQCMEKPSPIKRELDVCIDKVCVYYARYGVLMVYDLEDIENINEIEDKFEEWSLDYI